MFTIIGKRFTPEEFARYVEGVDLSLWKPSFCVIHNTAAPNLAQRPEGFTQQHMKNLQSYYSGKSWTSGPHLFVDDNGIWVFSPLGKRGTHSPSWNGTAWGIELLGDYDTDDPMNNRGAKVVQNAAAAVSVLLSKLGLDPTPATIRLHKEDVATTHACPGKHLSKSWFIAQVLKADTSAVPSGWSVVGPDGKLVLEDIPAGAKGTGIVRAVWEASGGVVDPDSEMRVIRLLKGD